VKISELAKKGIKKVRLPHWNKNAYLEIHITKSGRYGPWGRIVDPHGQKASGIPIGSQKILIMEDTDDRWEPFENK